MEVESSLQHGSGTVVVDALPYIDMGYDEAGVREAALALVEEETRRYRPTKNYLEPVLPPLNVSAFETPLMKAELDRVASRMPMDTLSMKRYELPTPPAGKMTDVAAWNECVDNSMAQLEHQRTRITNLELMQDYGCEAWKTSNNVLTNLTNRLQEQLKTLKKEIQEVNWARKNKQTMVGEKLKHLESLWVGLVSKNYEIEQAIVRMEMELPPSEQQKLLQQRQQEQEESMEQEEDQEADDEENT